MRSLIAACLVAAGLVVPASAGAAVVGVAPATLGPWQPVLLSSTGARLSLAGAGVSFVAGPAVAPAGTGSARLVTAGLSDATAQLRNTAFPGVPLGAVRALSYSTYVAQARSTQAPFLNLVLDLDANGTPDDEIFFEPEYQSGDYSGRIAAQPRIQPGVWQGWNARAGGWWAMRGLAGATPGAGVKTLDELVAAAPAARIVNTATGDGGVSLAFGSGLGDARADGNVDAFTIDAGSGPITYDFEPDPPPPVVGVSAVVNRVEGTITVRLPGKGMRRLRPLGENVPIGTIIDASKGKASITTAVTKRGLTQRAIFFAGAFEIQQRRGFKPVTDIRLRSASFDRECGAGVRGSAASVRRPVARAARNAPKARRSKKVVSRLWGDGQGKFRTSGRNSAATVRGTRWLTEERCDGTLTRVRRGVVRVRDLGTGRTVDVRAGESYLAERAQLRTRGAVRPGGT